MKKKEGTLMYIPVMKELKKEDFCEMFLLGRDVCAIMYMEESHSLFKTRYISAYRKRIDDVFADHQLQLPRHYTKEDVLEVLRDYDLSNRNVAMAGYYCYGIIHDLESHSDDKALKEKWKKVLAGAFAESPDYGAMVFKDIAGTFKKGEGVDNAFTAYMKKSYYDTYKKDL